MMLCATIGAHQERIPSKEMLDEAVKFVCLKDTFENKFSFPGNEQVYVVLERVYQWRVFRFQNCWDIEAVDSGEVTAGNW